MESATCQVQNPHDAYVLCARSWLVVCEQEGAATMVKVMRSDLQDFQIAQASPRPTDPALVYWLEHLLWGTPDPVRVASKLFDFLVHPVVGDVALPAIH